MLVDEKLFGILLLLVCSIVSPIEWDDPVSDYDVYYADDPLQGRMKTLLSDTDDYWEWFCKRDGHLFELFYPFLMHPHPYDSTGLFVYIRKIMEKCLRHKEFTVFSFTLYLITWRLIESDDFPKNEIKQEWVSWSISKHIHFGSIRYAEKLDWCRNRRNVRYENSAVTHKMSIHLSITDKTECAHHQSDERGIIKTSLSPCEQRNIKSCVKNHKIERWLNNIGEYEQC